MPERKNTFRVESDEVQGEGSFVVLRKPSWREQQDKNERIAEANGGAMPRSMAELARVTTEWLRTNREVAEQQVAGCVVRWNWVDDEGKPMPLPKDGGMAQLSFDEMQWLYTRLQPQAEAAKN